MYARNMAWLAEQNSPEFLPATVTAKMLANGIARDVAQPALKAGGLMACSAEVCEDLIGKTVLLPQD